MRRDSSWTCWFRCERRRRAGCQQNPWKMSNWRWPYSGSCRARLANVFSNRLSQSFLKGLQWQIPSGKIEDDANLPSSIWINACRLSCKYRSLINRIVQSRFMVNITSGIETGAGLYVKEGKYYLSNAYWKFIREPDWVNNMNPWVAAFDSLQPGQRCARWRNFSAVRLLNCYSEEK